jgi:hypothetical protein
MSQNQNQAPQEEATFTVTFVHGKKGLMAFEKVLGRFAFPDSKFKPKLGQSWKVSIVGENKPKNTVYFLKGLELIAEAQLEETNIAKPNKQQRVAPVTANDDDIDLSSNWHQRLRAPGISPMERAAAWLTPVNKPDMSTLAFSLAQRRLDEDEITAANKRDMLTNMDHMARVDSELKALEEHLNGFSRCEHRLGEQFFDLTRIINYEKDQIKRDGAAYARLCGKLKHDGENSALKAQVETFKVQLDKRRAAYKDEANANIRLDAEWELADIKERLEHGHNADKKIVEEVHQLYLQKAALLHQHFQCEDALRQAVDALEWRFYRLSRYSEIGLT